MLIVTAPPMPSIGLETEYTGNGIRYSELISCLSYALDLTEGQDMGHSVRTCLIGMRIAGEIGMPSNESDDLYYALLLKDAGCSSNSSRLFHILNADEIRAKRDVKTTDWTRVGWDSVRYAFGHVATEAPFLERMRTLLRVAANQQRESCDLVKIRCERGASITRKMGFSESVASAIQSLDEHWNGRGYPDGLRGRRIPLFSRIMNLAQTLDVFHTDRKGDGAIDVVRQRSGRWFDPDLVKAAESLSRKGSLWSGLETETARQLVVALEPKNDRTLAGDEALENVCVAFADVIDAKSPFTYRHSNGVAAAAIAIAGKLNMTKDQIAFLRRAALLHDIGKLSVPNSILEKPGKLTGQEWDVVKKHPHYTLEILRRISGFRDLSNVAAAHHEKLDGSGYFRNWGADQLSLPMRILAIADIYDALAARRPYRDAMPVEKVFDIMRQESSVKLDADCLEALMTSSVDSVLDDVPDALAVSGQDQPAVPAPLGLRNLTQSWRQIEQTDSNPRPEPPVSRNSKSE